MSKYNHFEMCEKIFGQKYKWNEHKHDYELYSRTDMWNKLVEQQQEIKKLNTCIDFYKSYYTSFHEKVVCELEKVREKLIEEINNQIKQLKCEDYHE